MSEEQDSESSGVGCGALIWVLVVAAAFYGAGWSIGDRSAVAATEAAKLPSSGNQSTRALIEAEYQPPSSFSEQLKKYQIGVTAENGAKWYGVFATDRFVDLGWWTWVPFFLLGTPILVLIPLESE